jgi:hypothetical protein
MMTIKTYTGSCTCVKNRFEVNLDLEQGTIKCNCEACTKTRFWCALVQPKHYRLLTDEDNLSVYHSEGGNQHFFCKYCGAKPFNLGRFIAVNLVALDDLAPEELAKAPIRYVDGRHGRFDQAPEFTAHL